MRWRRGAAGVAVAGLTVTLTGSAVATGPVASPDRPALDAAALLGVPVPQPLEPLVRLRALDASSRLSEKGGDLWEVSALGSFDVPEAAMRAYRTAARAVEETHPGCALPWSLLAGIGRVESDHGRYAGAVLGADGVSRPAIRGVALDGVGPVAAIPDSDGGRWDRDTVWDRAVGPMQFIPTTWEQAGRDGDGDGVADPHDLDDAALAAAGYLCPASGGIRDGDAMREAVFSYNHSDYYVSLVLAFERGYRTGSFTIPSPPVADPGRVAEAERPTRPARPRTRGAGEGEAERPARPEPERPAARPRPRPTAAPTPTPTPSPSAPPPVELVGVLRTAEGLWYVADAPVDLGTALDAVAAHDHDGDGSVETVLAELTALLGTEVTVEVEPGDGPRRVVRLNGREY